MSEHCLAALRVTDCGRSHRRRPSSGNHKRGCEESRKTTFDCHCLAASGRLAIVQNRRMRPSSAPRPGVFRERALLGRLAGHRLRAKSSQAAKQWQSQTRLCEESRKITFDCHCLAASRDLPLCRTVAGGQAVLRDLECFVSEPCLAALRVTDCGRSHRRRPSSGNHKRGCAKSRKTTLDCHCLAASRDLPWCRTVAGGQAVLRDLECVCDHRSAQAGL